MSEPDSHIPGLRSLIRKAMLTGLSALQNRGQLLMVELQEEKHLVIESLIWAMVACFMGMMFLVVLTATIIWLFPRDVRIYVAGGFCLLYLVGAVFSALNLKSLIKHSMPPFSDSLSEARKDIQWLESLK